VLRTYVLSIHLWKDTHSDDCRLLLYSITGISVIKKPWVVVEASLTEAVVVEAMVVEAMVEAMVVAKTIVGILDSVFTSSDFKELNERPS
jgi:hypothetical protein